MKFLITILTFLFVSQSAFAGLMLEPFLGYGMGTTKATNNSNVDTSSKETGTVFGGRVGYKSMVGLWVAGEYDLGSGKSKPDDSASTSSDFKHSSAGITAGFDLIFGLRVFAGYNFMDTTTFSTTGGDVKYKDGSSSKIGAGYKFPLIPVAVNLEYFMNNPKKIDVGNLGTFDMSAAYSSFKNTSIILSVSAPFDL